MPVFVSKTITNKDLASWMRQRESMEFNIQNGLPGKRLTRTADYDAFTEKSGRHVNVHYVHSQKASRRVANPDSSSSSGDDE